MWVKGVVDGMQRDVEMRQIVEEPRYLGRCVLFGKLLTAGHPGQSLVKHSRGTARATFTCQDMLRTLQSGNEKYINIVSCLIYIYNNKYCHVLTKHENTEIQLFKRC